MKIVTILLPLLLLSSCEDDVDKLDPREQAIEDIKSNAMHWRAKIKKDA